MNQQQKTDSMGANLFQEPKYKVGDQVIRKGELCTVRYVDHTMDPVSYTVQINGTDRTVGTEESRLSPVESAESSPKDNSHVQEEINDDVEFLEQSEANLVDENEDPETDSDEDSSEEQ